jgi:dTDP-4-dehydrorhamnose 3,5-epimerase
MEFGRTALPEVLLVTPRVFGDARGWLAETWQARKFAAGGIDARFVQDNHTHSRRHVLRGLHYQLRQPQGKLVRVLSGEIFDVAVDLRRSSPGFGRWVGEHLSADNRRMMWLPAGFAHGYLVLSEHADVFYKVTDFYAPEHERRLAWNDARLGIRWPLPAGAAPLLDPRDAAAPALEAAECFD